MNILKLIQNWESENLEFKEKFSDKVIETLVSFANFRWWKILIWIKDNWEIAWVNLWKETIQNWINETKNKTQPEIIPIIDIEELNWKQIVIFSIVEYPIKPISFKWKYYKRFKNSNHIIPFQEAMDLHLQSLSTSWDYYPDPNSDLNCIDIEKVNNFIKLLEKRKWIQISENPITVLKKFDLINKDNKVSFASSLLFKKIIPLSNSITLVKFQWTDKTIAKDDLLIKESPIFEVDMVMNFIKKNINKWIILKPWETRNTEVWDYPLEALREIVINAIVHKDYRVNPDIQIFIYDNRIEIANPWKFEDWFDLNWIKKWLYKSNSPNKLLASIFKELWIIERFWSWVKKIFNIFKENWFREPEIDFSQWFVNYICYKDYFLDLKKTAQETVEETVEKTVEETVEKNIQKIINALKIDNKITAKKLEKTTWLTRRWVEYNLKKLQENWIIKRFWPNKGGYWKILEQNEI